MIISTACERELPEFQKVIKKMDDLLNADARRRENYYTSRGGKKLEEDVYMAATKSAIGTPFEGKIKLVSGASFPDIVANRMYGIEVKSTVKNHWTSIGSSILESTRDQNVERIFMTFGKLGKPVRFISKPYEECLSDIVVTHYPRYKIDMQLQEKSEPTIFEKMNVDYDDLRKLDNPVPTVSEYYRSQLKAGQSLWWAADNEEEAAPMTVRLMSSLSVDERDELIAEGFAMYPEILGPKSKNKYRRYALWLVTQKSVVNTNLRDNFSAGGKVHLMTKDGMYVVMPRVFGTINKYKDVIREAINNADIKQLEENWKVKVRSDRLKQWCEIVSSLADCNVDNDIVLSVLEVIFKLDPYNLNEEALLVADRWK